MYSILISDDEIIERNYLKSVINKFPNKYFLLGEAVNGQEIVDMALVLKPNIIIMDIYMPLLNGLEAARIIKTNLKNIVIILNSAYAEFEFARQALDYNLDAYLLKPASEQNILDTIDSCLHKKQLKEEVNVSSANLTGKYPYSIIDQLIESIHTHDLKLIQYNISIYLDFLKSKQYNLEEYRLHIINTIFSIMRTINKVLPENVQSIIKLDSYLHEISKAKHWYEILNWTEAFFNHLMLFLKEDFIFNKDSIELIVKYIDECFQKQISLDSLSDIFHFSPSYISRAFHKNKGVTINTYINQKKINHAIYLLKTSDLAIKDIAYSCGFVNISHFNRVFKKLTNKVPSQINRKENTQYEDRA